VRVVGVPVTMSDSAECTTVDSWTARRAAVSAAVSRSRFILVDPGNRLACDTLEGRMLTLVQTARGARTMLQSPSELSDKDL
jgi:hypothetical protein